VRVVTQPADLVFTQAAGHKKCILNSRLAEVTVGKPVYISFLSSIAGCCARGDASSPPMGWTTNILCSSAPFCLLEACCDNVCPRRVWTICCIMSTGDTGGQAAAEQTALGLRLGHLLVEEGDTVMRAAAGGMNGNGRNLLRGGGILPSQREPYHL
jgi:hypothetical protein